MGSSVSFRSGAGYRANKVSQCAFRFSRDRSGSDGGGETENELLGRCQGGDGDDRREIEFMAKSDDANLPDEQWQSYEPRMRRQVRRLVRKHRAAIERVAAALLERGKLEASEIDGLLVGHE